MGMAVMGTGVAHGENRAIEAAHQAISSPLLEETSIDGARGVLLNVTGGPDMALHEIHEAAAIIRESAHEEAHIIFGAVIDEKLEDELRVTVIATGFHRPEVEARSAAWAPRQAVRAREARDLDEPYERRQRVVLDAQEGLPPGVETNERRLDIPTFVRRMMQ
jgi:cell division protein FtsZ